jgi:two-component system, NtrC family, sensor histidine kinase HydH
MRAFSNNSRWQAASIGAVILLLSLLHQFLPISALSAHNFLQHLYILPIIVAGLTFGPRGALLSSVAAGLAQAPHVLLTWNTQRVYAMDQVFELPVFCLAGVVSGLLAERERNHRASLEMTKRQLEDVYQELQQNVDRLKKAERLSAVGQLSAGLAHEIRNPLASISGAAGILKRGHSSEDNFRACLEIIEKETQRLNRLLTSFLEFARPRPPRFQRMDVSAVLQSVVSLAHHSAGQSSIRLECRVEDPLPEIDGDSEQLKQVLLNLLINAIQASPPDGTVLLQAAALPDSLWISVSDSGPGIPEGHRDCIFEPFFTTKEHGTGLGLALAAKIVEQHGGLLAAENVPAGGATFRLKLPIDRSHPL